MQLENTGNTLGLGLASPLALWIDRMGRETSGCHRRALLIWSDSSARVSLDMPCLEHVASLGLGMRTDLRTA